MTTPGHNSRDMLKSIIERVERLEDEKKQLSDDIKDVYAEAKGNGFDVKALRVIVRRRKQAADELAAHEAVVETYMHALGMLADLPLGAAAISAATSKLPTMNTANAPFHAPADDELRPTENA